MNDLPDGGHGDDNPVERSGNVRVSRISILDNWQDCFLCFLLIKNLFILYIEEGRAVSKSPH